MTTVSPDPARVDPTTEARGETEVESGTGAAAAGSPYRLEFVQGMRGIWCTIIVFAHADERLFPGAYAALDMFFVASGLVITLLLFRDFDKTGRVEFATFYLRRGRRLLPGLGVALTFTALGTLLFLSPLGAQATAARTGVFTAFQMSNLDLYRYAQGYFEVGARSVPLLHTWSLGVEEQVYLLVPASLLVAVILARRLQMHRVGAFATVISALSLGSFTLFVFWTNGVGELPGIRNLERAAFYLPVARAWEIGLGMLIACWYVAGRPLRPRLAATLASVGLVIIVSFTVLSVLNEEQRTSVGLLIPIGGLVLVLLGCREQGGWAESVLSWKPMVWVGDLSFSWYVWHLPVIVFARAWFDDTAAVSLAAAVVSFPIGWASYRWVERPLRYAPRGQARPVFVRRTTAIVLVSTVVPALCFLGVHASTKRSVELAAVAAMKDQIEPRRIADVRGCTAPDRRMWDRKACTIGADRPGTPIYLVGDSTAGMYAPVLRAAAVRHDGPLVLMNISGCPFVDAAISAVGRRADLCRTQVRDRLSGLERWRPGVVFTTVSDRMLQDGHRLIGGESTASLVGDGIYERALADTFGRVRKAGHQLVVAEPTPHPGAGRSSTEDWFARECPLVRMLTDVSACGRTVSEAAARASSGPVRTTLDRLGDLELHRVSTSEALCARGRCSSNEGDRWIFYDSNHVTHLGAMRLGDTIHEAITEAWSKVSRAQAPPRSRSHT